MPQISQFRFFDCLKTGHVLWIQNAPLFYIRNTVVEMPIFPISESDEEMVEMRKWVVPNIKHVTSFLTENTKFKTFDFGVFEIKMKTSSLKKTLLRILFGAFHRKNSRIIDFRFFPVSCIWKAKRYFCIYTTLIWLTILKLLIACLYLDGAL